MNVYAVELRHTADQTLYEIAPFWSFHLKTTEQTKNITVNKFF